MGFGGSGVSSQPQSLSFGPIRDHAADRQQMINDRNNDLAAGRARGQELFGNGSLGRVAEGRSQEVSDIVNRRKDESNGFTPGEMSAYRDTQQTDLNQSLAGKLRQLKIGQAQSGVTGAAATAQNFQAAKDANVANIGNERDLFLKNIDAKRAGLNSYESSVGAARTDEQNRQLYNQAQMNKEKLGQVGTEMGYGSLGAADRGSLTQLWGAQDAADATREQASKSK